MEITSSGVSVYEVVLDLKQWEGLQTSQVPGFADALVALMPSTARHKCMSGQVGGFHEELARGTNFGHVVEHVLLELIRLANPDQAAYSGWTKELGEGRYVIHYGAPGFLAGRLAAILAVEIVSRLLQRETPDLSWYVDQMRRPVEYFSQQRARARTDGPPLHLDLEDDFEPAGGNPGREPAPTLSDWQQDNLVQVLTRIEDQLPEIRRRWQDAFCSFGGDFARGILDKVELINADQFVPCFVKGDFRGYFRGVANIGQMLRSLRIPLSFVTHSAWLYKNFMQLAILEDSAADTETQTATIWDFDDFYQNVFHAVLEGYRRPAEVPPPDHDLTLCGFRARHARSGRVLVVDDDLMARKVARNILESRGFATEGVRDGVAALQALASGNGDIGVVLLDLVMPGLPGPVVCRRIRDTHPSARVILCSGFPLDPEAARCLDAHDVAFLQKPYGAAALVDLVGDLMDLWVTGRGNPELAS